MRFPFSFQEVTMRIRLLSTVALCCGAAVCGAAEFEPPVRLSAEGKAIRVESPGYAAPCWADVDGDGKKDLLVGQFRQGKIQRFKSLGDGKFAKGEWLMAGGKVAEVPGVW
jgi:hypothetical protein